NRFIFLLLILNSFCMSCGNSISSREEFQRFIFNKKNGLKKEINTQRNIGFVMTYMPYQLFPARIKSNDQDNLYFSLQIAYNDKPLSKQAPPAMYNELVQLFSFDFRHYITYTYGGSSNSVR